MAIVKTYAEKAQEPNTEKVLLAHLEPSQRAITWVLDSGAIFKRSVNFYVIDTKEDTTSLVEASSKVLSSGEWFFESETNTVFARLSDDSNPKDSFISLTFRLFMSDAPYVQTHDLTETGDDVEYEGRVKNNPSFPQEIDSANQLGIALESSGSLTLENTDGFWEDIFDKLIWENKRVALFSWFPDTAFSESNQIFEGQVQDKTYTENTVTFRLKDQIIKLRQDIALGFFSASDGDVSDDVIGTPKRRLYGEVKGVKMQSIDQTLAGFTLTGTISGTSGGTTVSGSGTDFLDELSPGDEINFTVGTDDKKIIVETITSDTAFEASTELDATFSALSATNLPEIPYRRKNRTWHLAGHKLREPTTTISAVEQPNRITLVDISDFLVNDTVKVNGVVNTIKRIFGSDLVLLQNLVAPSPGQTVIRNPIRKVTFKKLNFVLDRDFTLINAAEAKIVFNSLAEFNITIKRKVIGVLTFTTSSRSITGVSTKFLSDFKPRDWVVGPDLSHQVFYEILQVTDDTAMEIRIAYAGTTISTGVSNKKNVRFIDDDSVVITNTVGMERSGEWVKTGSDVVKDILENDAIINNLDASSFSESDIDAPYIVALKIPLNKGAIPPKIRDVISIVNKSVFGSLVAKNDSTIAFNVLSPEKPTTLSEIGDDDILSFSVKTRTKVVRKVNGQFNFFDADVNTEESGHSLIETTNTSAFVDNLVGSKDILTRQIHIFDVDEATIIAERYAFLHSLTQSIVTIKSKMNFMLNNINDKVFLGLDRLYKRFGSATARKKIAIISKISRSGQGTQVEMTDLSGIFNRVATVADDSTSDFSSATDTEKILSGFVVDDSTELPDSAATTDDEFGINLVG